MGAAPDRVLERLMALHPKVIDLSLDRVWRLLDALGNPQDTLPPVIHVAGTNGKGSTIAFLRAMLEAAGVRVHVYTSPHLVRFNERIRLAGEPIGDGALTALLEEAEAANGAAPITYFEITTCAALLGFSRTPADVVLLETGLGGRLDATNVVARPAVTVLTPIALDHQQFLGDTLAAIATEKAHIMKPGVPCVSARQPAEAAAVITRHAAAVGAPLAVAGHDFHMEQTSAGLTYHGRGGALPLPAPALAGAHQIDNAAVALAVLDHLAGIDVPPAARAKGMADAHWPARLQRLTQGPLADALPQGWELWLDGGHNPAAGRVLAGMVETWGDTPTDAILGMIGPKDAAGFLAPLAPCITRLRTVPVDGHDTKTPEEMARIARQAGIGDTTAHDTVTAALHDLIATAPGPRRVLICGSLYLAGAVLADNG